MNEFQFPLATLCQLQKKSDVMRCFNCKNGKIGKTLRYFDRWLILCHCVRRSIRLCLQYWFRSIHVCDTSRRTVKLEKSEMGKICLEWISTIVKRLFCEASVTRARPVFYEDPPRGTGELVQLVFETRSSRTLKQACGHMCSLRRD